MAVAQRYQDELSGIKKNIENAHEYFSNNYKIYNDFKKFVFATTISQEDEAVLQALNKPQIEFNVLESYVSRLRGEFSKAAPEIEVSSESNRNQGSDYVDVVEDHIRYLEDDFRKEGDAYQVYSDQLSGGYSVMKVYTDYSHYKSFDQDIFLSRVFDPVLCGFDPMAKEVHKGDGNFCYEVYPMRKDEFKERYPNVDITNIKFKRNSSSFSWAYRNMKEDILLLVDYYEKKKKRLKIVQLSDRQVMTDEDYKKFVEEWNMSGNIEQVPQVIDERWTCDERIDRYILIEDQVIHHEKTNYRYLPLVFVDGNSVKFRETINSDVKQMVRPYIYQAKDAQRLKNLAGQSLANELENMVQHKWKVAKEGIPPGYEDAYINNQLPTVMIYNATHPDNPDQQLPAPQEVSRIPTPPEVTNTFTLVDQLIQNILGSYDAALGINDNQLSGIAVVEAATQSNAASMPYIVSYMHALNQVAKILVDLIPKYYVTPRSIPTLSKDGKRGYRLINQPGQPTLEYDENALKVKVEAGLNFTVQKSKALRQITALMQASPMFAQFINQKGLPILLDNMEIRGIDDLKEQTSQFMQMIEQQQAQAAQQQSQAAQQPNPLVMRAENERMKLQLNEAQNHVDNQLKAAELQLEKEKLDTEQEKILSNLHIDHADNMIKAAKVDAERTRTAVDLASKAAGSVNK